ncbi:BT_3928 family protein [Lacinutrix algicola]|uniref:BT_3928 family protein n=1 Tax=Lacinutrix algicola TaxID=342954 RepID=UPI0006E39B44|nr:BT_3928 family protein [Lacinutrix algicola]
MKYLVHICRLLVGGLFIFSGLIKLNDPLGFSYKLQEYFSTEVLNLPSLDPYALGISVFVVVLEVVLGVFLLIGYKRKFTVYMLLAMIVFFTFLTFYAAYFEVVKDCGCFGDFLPLKPWESFTKDLILLILILVLVAGIKYIKPLFGKFPTTILALLGFIGSLWFGYHVLMHLPTWDFRAYAVGKNIAEGIVVPDDAQKAVQEYTWTFNVGGENLEYITDGSYPTVDGEYVGVETKVLVEAYDPPVKDFSIETEDEDFTTKFLAEDHLIMVVAYNLEKANEQGLKNIKKVTDKAIENGYTVIGLSSSGDEDKQYAKEKYGFDFDFYLCDEKALKTVVRSNPGILKLEKGTVMQKEHFNDAEEIDLPKVERKPEPVIIINMAYFVNEEEVTKAEVEALDPETIESMNVIKEGSELKILNSMTSSNYTELIKITLKEE